MEPRFTLRQIRYFLAAARAGSVTQASYDVNISAPSVSAAISQLEDQFNIQLFVRHHSHGLLLTEAGKTFFAATKEFYEHAEKLEDEAQGLGKSVSGVVYAGCFITLAPLIIPVVSNAFSREYPDARLVFSEGHQASLFESLRDGIVQMAFTYEMSIGRDMEFEPLGEVAPYCILPEHHPLAKRDVVELGDLEQEPMILLDLPKSSEYYMSLYDLAKVTPRVVHRTTSPEVVRVMVAHGLGYSILAMPTLHSVSVDGTAFTVKPLAGDLPKLRIGLLATADTVATNIYDAVLSVSRNAIESLLLPTDASGDNG